MSSNEAANLLRSRREATGQLPPPEETWTVNDVGDALAGTITRFRHADIVRVVRNEYDERNVYRTAEHAWDYRQEVYQPELPGPCNHRGIRTLDADARVYTCLDDGCDATFGAAVFRARADGEEAVAVTDGGEPADGMAQVSLRVPHRQLERIEALVDRGHYPSRSEAIRAAVRRELDE